MDILYDIMANKTNTVWELVYAGKFLKLIDGKQTMKLLSGHLHCRQNNLKKSLKKKTMLLC